MSDYIIQPTQKSVDPFKFSLDEAFPLPRITYRTDEDGIKQPVHTPLFFREDVKKKLDKFYTFLNKSKAIAGVKRERSYTKHLLSTLPETGGEFYMLPSQWLALPLSTKNLYEIIGKNKNHLSIITK